MTVESKLDEINKKIDRIQQMQDFTTLQTTFLGISFALFIFSITILVTDVNPLFKLISIIILEYSIPLLIDVFISIFSNNWGTKLDTLNRVVMWVILVFVTIIVLSIVFGISMQLTKTFENNNFIFVSLILIVFVSFTILYFRFINPRYEKRFNELFKMVSIERPTKGIIAYLDRIITKRAGCIAFSILVGLFITFMTGYVETTPFGETNIRSYGLPFSWLQYQNETNTTNYFNYPIFVLNMFIFSFGVFVIITLYEHFFIRKEKKKRE